MEVVKDDLDSLKSIIHYVYEINPDGCFFYNNKDWENGYCEGAFEDYLGQILDDFEQIAYPSCGCGSPENVRLLIYKFLKGQDADYTIKTTNMNLIFGDLNNNELSDGMLQFMYHTLGAYAIFSHGSSVYSSTLTERGKLLLLLLDMYYRYELDK